MVMPIRIRMPLTYREAVQIALLLFCVPAQYLLSTSMQSDHSAALSRSLASDLRQFKERWLSPEAWSKSAFEAFQWLVKGLLPDPSPNILLPFVGEDESPAYEVFKYRQERGYFATSIKTRNIRQAHVSFRVGQVVKHRAEGYIGVIIGWDIQAKASETWLGREYEDLQALRSLPHYAILVDERDPIILATMAPEATYVNQEDLDLMSNTEVQHPLLVNYFVAYDGGQYIAQEWLRKLYPKD